MQHLRLAAIATVLLVVGLAYSLTLKNEFVYDDQTVIVQNPSIRSLGSIPQFFTQSWWAGTEEVTGNFSGDGRYRPLVNITYALNYAAGGINPVGYHLANLLLHLGACVMLYLLALQLGWQQTGALFATIGFGIHPLHVEPVAWVTGRPELLMALMVLTCLWAAQRGRAGFSLACFAAALLSKEQAVVVPALLFLLDMCRKDSPPSPPRWSSLTYWMRRYGPYLLVLTGYLILRFLVLGGFGEKPYPFLQNPLEHLKGAPWLLSLVALAGYYLRLSLWPDRLSVDYSYNSLPAPASALDPAVLWGLASWGLLFALAGWSWRTDRRVTFAIGFCILTFLPASNLLISVGTPMGERLFYLPLAGLCLLLGLALEKALRRTAGRAPAIAGALVVVLCALPAWRTFNRTQDWNNNEALFRSALAALPNNVRIHELLGAELKRQGGARLEEALSHYQTALTLYPDYVLTHPKFASNLGSVLLELGRTTEAIDLLEQAVALNPHWSTLHYSLGYAYERSGKMTDARTSYLKALRASPDNPRPYAGLASLFLREAHYGQALQAAEAALRRDPQYGEALSIKARALQALRQHEMETGVSLGR